MSGEAHEAQRNPAASSTQQISAREDHLTYRTWEDRTREHTRSGQLCEAGDTPPSGGLLSKTRSSGTRPSTSTFRAAWGNAIPGLRPETAHVLEERPDTAGARTRPRSCVWSQKPSRNCPLTYCPQAMATNVPQGHGAGDTRVLHRPRLSNRQPEAQVYCTSTLVSGTIEEGGQQHARLFTTHSRPHSRCSVQPCQGPVDSQRRLIHHHTSADQTAARTSRVLNCSIIIPQTPSWRGSLVQQVRLKTPPPRRDFEANECCSLNHECQQQDGGQTAPSRPTNQRFGPKPNRSKPDLVNEPGLAPGQENVLRVQNCSGFTPPKRPPSSTAGQQSASDAARQLIYRVLSSADSQLSAASLVASIAEGFYQNIRALGGQGAFNSQKEMQQLCLRTVSMLKSCEYPMEDLLCLFAVASSRLSFVITRLKTNDLVEIVHIALLQVFLAHSWLFDEACPIKEWHNHVFRSYCTFNCLNSALTRLFRLQDWRLHVEPTDVLAQLFTLIPQHLGRQLSDHFNRPHLIKRPLTARNSTLRANQALQLRQTCSETAKVHESNAPEDKRNLAGTASVYNSAEPTQGPSPPAGDTPSTRATIISRTLGASNSRRYDKVTGSQEGSVGRTAQPIDVEQSTRVFF